MKAMPALVPSPNNKEVHQQRKENQRLLSFNENRHTDIYPEIFNYFINISLVHRDIER